MSNNAYRIINIMAESHDWSDAQLVDILSDFISDQGIDDDTLQSFLEEVSENEVDIDD